jgi:hypothetical protein
MPRLSRAALRRAGPVGTALFLWDIWQRIPPKQRRQLVAHARKHGPRLARRAYEARRRRPR